MKHKRIAFAVLAVVVLVVVGMGYAHLQRNLATYDQRYVDCMEYAKSFRPGYVIPFPSDDYTRTSDHCEEAATNGRAR